MGKLIRPTGTELRAFTFDDFEIRASTPNADGTIPFKGHAAVFNRKADIGGYFTEQFEPGAFKRTIGQADIRMLINHDTAQPLARTKAGSLRLSEDSKGLYCEADMTPTSYAQDLALLMESRVVTEMSIGFSAVRETWDETPKIPARSIQEARLFDVSPVTFPAYQGTDASLRNAQLGTLLSSLGLDEMAEEERNALILAIASGDVAPEHRDQLIAAQERFALLVSAPVATTQQSEGESRGEDHDEARSVNLELLRRRHALTGQIIAARAG